MNVVNPWNAKYTYAAMQSDLKKLSEKYAEFMSFDSIGTTYDDRKIYEVTVGNVNAKRHIMIQATMHAREYINSLLVMRQLECICANYYTGTYNGYYYSELLDKVCLHILPMVNPDGVSISQFGAKGINNTALRNSVSSICNKYGGGRSYYYTRWKANARGVDLNRNYPLNWDKLKTINHPANSMFKGYSACSEKETNVMINRINGLKPKCVISYHSTGSVIYWSFAQPAALRAKNRKLFNVVNYLTKYRSANSSVSKAPCFGDWIAHVKKTPTLTIETGVGEAPIKIGEFSSIWNKNKNVLPAVLLWTINNTK